MVQKGDWSAVSDDRWDQGGNFCLGWACGYKDHWPQIRAVPTPLLCKHPARGGAFGVGHLATVSHWENLLSSLPLKRLIFKKGSLFLFHQVSTQMSLPQRGFPCLNHSKIVPFPSHILLEYFLKCAHHQLKLCHIFCLLIYCLSLLLGFITSMWAGVLSISFTCVYSVPGTLLCVST